MVENKTRGDRSARPKYDRARMEKYIPYSRDLRVACVFPTVMSWKKAFEAGLSAFKDRRYEDAVGLFTQSIEAHAHPHVLDSRAAAYEQLKRYREALSDTRKCISLQPDRYQSYFRTARIFLSMGKHDRCLQMVDAARKRLNPLDTGYPKRIEELSKMEQSARQAEAQRRAHVDPLRKLPLELLVDICRSVVQQMDLERPRGASHFAVTLGSVCQSLRELVHSTPWFWQSLTISDRYFGRKSSFWLDRLDGQALYSLSLVGIGFMDWTKITSFLEATGPGCWRHLSMEGTSLHIRNVYDFVRPLDLRLHSLRIQTPPDSGMGSTHAYDPFELVPLFAPLPDSRCARKLSLRVETLSMSCTTLPHITHLELGFNKLVSSQLEPLFYILRAVPNLQSLVIRPANVFVNNQHPDLPPLPDFKDTPVLRLEHLEELRISTIGPLQSLTTLQFPKLQILDLQQLPVAKPAILLRYLTDCDPSDRPPLRELRLSRVAMHPPLLFSLLATFHKTLETLEVSHCSALSPDVFTLLFPNLKDVNFSGTDELRGSDLVRLVKQGQGKIRNVVVDGCVNVDAEALPWLRANVTGCVSCVYKTRAEAKGRRRDRYL
ncbi:TPR-1 domain protein [Rhizoctonia solani AG-3 Rhs1AP]|uniref:TPR-1 domain protein n=1 Tax=Rhizoctonia solani AG-3 Rhs1AP TaxID=1086054 RepID=X8J7A3_9AGAM|nr:TPR-1 domain protein [Rhizoctonia solani AG-3 Rhs1AP]